MSAAAIPFVKGKPVVGVGLRLALDPEGALKKMYREHGPTFRFKAGHFDYVCMAGPDANEFINSEGKDYFITRPFWEPLAKELDAPNAVVVLDGEDHKKVRSVLRQPLSRKVVEDNIPDLVPLIRQNMDACCEADETAFVFASQKLSSNIVGHLLADVIPSDDELKYFFDYANTLTVMLNVLRLPRFLLRLRGLGFRRARKVAEQLMDRVVAKALTEKHSRKLLVDALLEAQKQYPELYTEGDIRNAGFLSFFGGIDTMGQTLSFMLWELLKHPDQLQALQEEVDRVMSACHGEPSPADLQKNMPLCRGAFMETLRMHPTAFAMVRAAACDFEFQGYPVKKGQDILLYSTISHHDASYFPEPQRFDIYRYSEPRNEHRQRGVYAPFGRGNHTCAGAAWSEAQSVLMTSVLLYNYSFTMSPEMAALKKQMKTTPTLGEKFRVSVSKRK